MTTKQLTRNNQIIADYNAGVDLRAMADYYKISIPRIYAILRHSKTEKRKSPHEKQQNRN